MNLVAARMLLAAFPALGGTDLSDSPSALLFRIAALTALHGPAAPGELLKALTSAGETSAAQTAELVLAFLETGRGIGRRGVLPGSPLPAGGGAVAGPASLRAWCELFAGVRRALRPQDPAPGAERDAAAPSSLVERAADEATVLVSPPDLSYALVLVCVRRDLSRTIAAALHALLPRLSPAEAAWALWAWIHQEQPAEALEFLLITHDGGRQRLRWSYRRRPEGYRDPDAVQWCLESLPVVDPIVDDEELLLAYDGNPVVIRATTGDTNEITLERMTGGSAHALVCAAVPEPSPRRHRLVERTTALLDEYLGGRPRGGLRSVALGQLHLGRSLGIAEEDGVAVCGAVLSRLATDHEPVTVMVGELHDDHALVRLTPRDHRAFLLRRLPGRPVVVIPRSSPLLRAIAVALYHRMLGLGLGHRVQRRGSRLFADLGDGGYRQLLAAEGGGGLLLELAALTYRSAPELFDAWSADRFALPGPVHGVITELLDERLGYPATERGLADLDRRFAAVTDLRHPDPAVGRLVDDALSAVPSGTAHVNVLGDFYAAQQRLVRVLAAELQLPFRLLSVHFSTTTGKVALRVEEHA